MRNTSSYGRVVADRVFIIHRLFTATRPRRRRKHGDTCAVTEGGSSPVEAAGWGPTPRKLPPELPPDTRVLGGTGQDAAGRGLQEMPMKYAQLGQRGMAGDRHNRITKPLLYR